MTTAKQVKQEIIDFTKAEYFEKAWPDFLEELKDWSSTPPEVQLPSGTAKFFKRYGGEGLGEEYWVIFSVGDELFKVVGYYSSWDGSSWDDAEIYKVEPVEVTVIEYQAVED